MNKHDPSLAFHIITYNDNTEAGPWLLCGRNLNDPEGLCILVKLMAVLFHTGSALNWIPWVQWVISW